MKKLLYIIFSAMGALMFIQCSDWTEMEPQFTEPVNANSENYYKALREYKKTKHPVVFGWYSEWTGTGINMNNQLRGIPDSMDIVSLWSGAYNLTEAQKSDLKEVREKKGTRVLVCQFATNLGGNHTPASVTNDHIVDGVKYNTYDEAMAAYWGWYNGNGDASAEGVEKAIRKYARVIIDSINKYDYNGLDIDFEPNIGGYAGNISSYPDRMLILLDELSKELGPKSGTERILMVDGEPQTLEAEAGPLLSYYVIQSYGCWADKGYYDSLDDRFERLLTKFGSLEDEATILEKTIWCENFEMYKNTGGPSFTTRDRVRTYSLKGMAMYYRPGVDARLGGVGAYRFNLCRPVNDYFYMREAIQTLNPAKH